jgi:transcription initiation factor IIF auxiliary subunit
LEERFAPPNQIDLYRVQLKERRQKASETLPELGQAIQRLVNKAYPKAPAEVRETLSTEHFLDALVNSEMRIRIKQSRPDLNQAICLAVELDALYKAEKKNEFGRAHLRGATVTDETKNYKDNKEDKLVEMMQAFNKKLDDLQKDLEKVKRNQAGTQRNTRISAVAPVSTRNFI